MEPRLKSRLTERRHRGLERELSVTSQASFGTDLINLADNDYLDLANDPALKAAAQEALAQWGCSASASPLITGYRSLHRDLERALCKWLGFPHGLVWTTGYAANSALLSLLPQRGDIVLADRLIHNSMINGILRSGARLIRYRHCDLDHLEALLQEPTANGRLAFVVTETVFSMDGDYPDLAQMAKLKERYGFTWMVDEAHALGWYGPHGNGLLAEAGVTEAADIVVGTLGKALGSMGAFTLFRQETVRRYLINEAGEFIYSTYLAPPCAAAALQGITCLRDRAPQRSQWHDRSSAFRRQLQGVGLNAPHGDSPIVPIILGEVAPTLAAARALKEDAILVPAIRPPTVPAHHSRLRLSLKASFNEALQERVLDGLKPFVAQVP